MKRTLLRFLISVLVSPLVLVEAKGKVLADTYRGDDYLGPGHVLRETVKLLERGR